ncbi:MAG: hypothetical protein V8S90_08375 [Lachnospiraceae bacterium]
MELKLIKRLFPKNYMKMRSKVSGKLEQVDILVTYSVGNPYIGLIDKP